MTREQANQILNKYLTNPNLIKHCLAAEVAMRALYKRLNDPFDPSEEEKWGITGLLHDADYEMAKGIPEKHGLLLFEKEQAIPTEIAYAIKSHNYQYTQILPVKKMDWAITCVDQLTGLIVAAALIHKDKKLASIDTDFVIKRMNQSGFAKGADRKQILLCQEKLGIPLNEFVEITLKAMQSISTQLGL